MTDINKIYSELTIIGTGMAGMAAAYFASKNKIETTQIGINSGIIYSSGFFDLMGVHPIEDRKTWENPWQAIDKLVSDIPDHPYARLGRSNIESAMDQFMEFMNEAERPYMVRKNQNTKVITPVGTVKSTYGVPRSMWAGAVALKEKHPCLIVDFWGLKAFSAKQITDMLMPRWPGIRPLRISFPAVGPSSDLYPEQMARSLEIEANRIQLAEAIRPDLGDAAALGLPAILGIYKPRQVREHLEELLGVDIFEIPTIPPSLPGLRLKEAIEAKITGRGVRLLSQKRVLSAAQNTDGTFELSIGDRATSEIQQIIGCNAVILAGGRFLGMGLHAGRKKIREPLFDLPVFQPEDRALWHQTNFFDPRGHQISQAGLEIDDSFRPTDLAGKPVYDNLFAAGSILAHQDWMRQKCGAGLSIATAYGAVKAFKKLNIEHPTSNIEF
ncbi:MAG: glycerol-3-phosphate dehydrogenase subunit GlpB [Desulfobacteraceae bacterium]|nr:glycerol-3-phosphate dehydrogenase subunit GlpB [Desulfobacteraceae bacterium]MBC2755386.1 glycerol-3-phosphate dehydrogenase subunit GlpB [Desulfobacteraceae bacterium]